MLRGTFNDLLYRLRALLRRKEVERELDEELRFHFEKHVEENLARGMSRREAVRQARLAFGGLDQVKEECREARGTAWIDELWRNLRYAGRSLHKRPGFTAIAVLSLGLGIGGNVAVFSLLNRVVLARLPVRVPESLYQVMVSGGVMDSLSYPKYERLRDNFDLFEALFGWVHTGGYELNRENRVRDAQLDFVTGNYFDTLGIRPARGRLLRPEDDRLGASVSIVLSYRTWREFFGADENVVGRSVKVRDPIRNSDATFEVVGVAPPNFLGLRPGSPADAYVPFHAKWRFNPGYRRSEGGMDFYTMARLKRNVPLPAAEAVLRARWPRLTPFFGENPRPENLLLKDGSRGYSPLRKEFSRALYVLMGLAAAVLLIACANLTSLLVVRMIEQTGETSMRYALGASRGQILRQWMTETLLIAGVGGIAGLLSANWITKLLLLFVEESERSWLDFQMDSAAVALIVGLTIAAGLLVGLLPALRASRSGIHGLIKEQSSGVIGRHGRVAHAVLAGQAAVALVLVASAALFGRTLWNLYHTPAGLETETLAYVRPQFYLTLTEFPRDKAIAAMKEVVVRLGSSTNVASVTRGTGLPFVGDNRVWGSITKVPGYVLTPDEQNRVFFRRVAPGFFETLRIPMLAGRDFREGDQAGDSPPVVIVNQRFARHYFPGRDPIGHEFESGPRYKYRIIGVVGNTTDMSLRDQPPELVYSPTATGYPQFVVRAKPGVEASVCEAEVRAMFASLAPNVPIESVTFKKKVQESLGRDRLVAQLSAGFGVLGMLLAAVGLYGAAAHMARSRRREIGLRIALGAQRTDIVRLMLRENLWVTLAGIAVGLAGAVASGRVIESLLFGVAATDPLALGIAAILLTLVALTASLGPALRAAELDPSHTLRCE